MATPTSPPVLRAPQGTWRSDWKRLWYAIQMMNSRSVDERTARRRLDRRHVAGHNEIGWLGIRRDRREHRGRPIGGADPGRHPPTRLDGRAVRRHRAPGSGRDEGDPELTHALGGEHQADQASGMGDEEVDAPGRHLRRGRCDDRLGRFRRVVDDEHVTAGTQPLHALRELLASHARQTYPADLHEAKGWSAHLRG